MSPTKVIARLRQLAKDWRREEARLCEQFGDVIAPQSMRARQIKDTQAIDAAVGMIDRLAALPARITPEQAPEYVRDYSHEAAEGYADGWNDCIKAMRGEGK